MPKGFVTLSSGVIAAALALSACGSSSNTSTSSGATTTIAPAGSPTTAAVGRSVLVKTKTDAKLGVILADATDKTLYTLTSNGQAVACTGPCAAVWPPLSAPAGVTTPSAGPGVTGLGVAAGPDGTQVVTADNLPLHLFAKDQGAGDANGEGLQSFGGVWHVVKAQGTTPTSAPPAPASTGARSSGGGY